MQQCPHCGSPVDGEQSCPNCGQSFEDYAEPARADSETETLTPTNESTESAHTERPNKQPAAEAPPERDGVRISRRALLGGAGASVALLGAGGVGWWYLQSGGDGNRVVQSYVNAIAANNWARVPSLYHEDAPLMQQIGSGDQSVNYEDYLRRRDRLETLERLEPELKSLEEFYHITEVTVESLRKLRVGVDATAAETIDEIRRVLAFASVSVEAIRADQDDIAKYYKNGTENLALPCTLVRSEGTWLLWTARLSTPL